MATNFDIALPKELAILPIHGAVLMPKSQLVLPIIDVEHLSIIADAVRDDMYLGVVQPISPISNSSDHPILFNTGTLAKITELSEVEEGRILITLTGICRFKVEKEINKDGHYRVFEVDYDHYLLDLVENSDDNINRERLLAALRNYFKTFDLSPNWQEINNTPDQKLIRALTMACPFDPREKQALLESPTLLQQSEVMTTLIEIASFGNPNDLQLIH